MLKKIFNQTKLLEKALDAAWLRNEVISHNIANADTPGYKKMGVSFEDELKSAIDAGGFNGKKTRARHIDIGSKSIDEVAPRVFTVESTRTRIDENNVDIEAEMVERAKNEIYYNALIQKLSMEFQRLSNIINEGRR